MNSLYYRGKTLVDLKRVFPRSANMCKLSVYANVLNHFGYKKKYGRLITPEKLLIAINYRRKRQGLSKLDVNRNIIPTSNLIDYAQSTKLLNIKVYKGIENLDKMYFKSILADGGIIGAYHMMIYENPKFIKNPVISKISKDEKFNYKNLKLLVKETIKEYGPFDLGHIDSVLDIRNIKGTDYIIFANTNSVDNKFPIKIPWNLYKNYLSWDWYSQYNLSSEKDIPSKRDFNILRNKGYLRKKGYEFVSGMHEIYLPKVK